MSERSYWLNRDYWWFSESAPVTNSAFDRLTEFKPDPAFAFGTEPIPPAILPFGGERLLCYIDDFELFAWTCV